VKVGQGLISVCGQLVQQDFKVGEMQVFLPTAASGSSSITLPYDIADISLWLAPLLCEP